jgi:hypothetical protein
VQVEALGSSARKGEEGISHPEATNKRITHANLASTIPAATQQQRQQQ